MYEPILRTVAKNIDSRFKYPIRKIADLLNVSKSTIHRWLSNNTIKAPRIKQFYPFNKIIQKYVSENPHCRLKDIQHYLLSTHNKQLSLSSICKYLRLLRISYKKISFQNYTNWDKLQLARIQFQEQLKTINKHNLISLDESYFYKQLNRTYGYSKIGEKCIVPKRANLKKYSLMLAISSEKCLCYDISMTSYNRVSFYNFLKNKLLPLCKNKTLLMDNVPFHKCKEILKLIKDSGNKVLFIPPYSPEFNPIEIVFRILKSKLCLLQEINQKDIVKYLDEITSEQLTQLYNHCLG